MLLYLGPDLGECVREPSAGGATCVHEITSQRSLAIYTSTFKTCHICVSTCISPVWACNQARKPSASHGPVDTQTHITLQTVHDTISGPAVIMM